METNRNLVLSGTKDLVKKPGPIAGEFLTFPELAPFSKFYSILRPATLVALDLGEQLLRNDPDIPDPTGDPVGHKNASMRKYGVHLQLPDTPITLGFYSLARWRYLIDSTPTEYSPGFKSENLKRFIGLEDPLETVLYGANLLMEQAKYSEPLRPTFRDFPVQELKNVDMQDLKYPKDFIYRDMFVKVANEIGSFKQNALKWCTYWVYWEQPRGVVIDVQATKSDR